MNTRLRNSLSALVVAASLVSLGYALGEPPRPGALVADLGQEAVTVLTREHAAVEREPAAAHRSSRIAFAMPYFSFGQRAVAGVQ
jgi:hypothetical protein